MVEDEATARNQPIHSTTKQRVRVVVSRARGGLFLQQNPKPVEVKRGRFGILQKGTGDSNFRFSTEGNDLFIDAIACLSLSERRGPNEHTSKH